MKKLLPAVGLALLLPAHASGAADRDYYFYQRSERPGTGVGLELTGAASSIEAGALSRRGFEGEARIDWWPAGHWVIEGGTTLGTGASAVRAEARYDFTTDGVYDAVIQAGLGYRSGFDGVGIPYVRLGSNGQWDAWHLAASALVEAPQGGMHDSQDLILGFGFSHPAGEALRLGFELVGEDLEGFWEAQEAEGGARLVLGPTLNTSWRATTLRLNTGWVYALTRNEASTDPVNADVQPSNGFVAHLTLMF